MSTGHNDQNGGDDDAYLWDGSGQAPPDIAALEKALAPLAHRAPSDSARISEASPVASLAEARQRRRRALRRTTVAIAVVAAAAAVAILVAKKPHRGNSSGVGLAFVVDGGAADVGGTNVTKGILGPGQQLRTADRPARVDLPTIGELSLAPQSALRLIHLRADEQRLSLARGRIDARVVAPPRLFVVETPRATVVDLGCAYTIVVDDAGIGHIQVSSGLVEVVEAGRTLVIIRGFESELGTGNGLPLRLGAHPEFVTTAKALLLSTDTAAASLARAIALAAADDAPTLAHLLPVVASTDRATLIQAITALVGPPTNTSVDAVLSGSPDAIALWITSITNEQLRRQSVFFPGKSPAPGKSAPSKNPGGQTK